MSSFFTKCGVSGVMTAYELFNHLTGLDITADNHEEFLVKISKGDILYLLDCPSFVKALSHGARFDALSMRIQTESG